MKQTENYQLNKIELTDAPPDITVLNDNWDTLDAEVKNLADANISDGEHRTNKSLHLGDGERSAWNSKSEGNHNHDSVYAPVGHSNNGVVHVSAENKVAWNSKAEANHNHEGTYAPLGHSNNNDLHTSLAEKNKLAGVATAANNYVHPLVHAADIISETAATKMMTADERIKLAGIDTGSNNYLHPAYTAKANGLYKVAVDNLGHVNNAVNVGKGDITALGIPSQDTTYGSATTSVTGLMSAADKYKLNGMAVNANNYIHPDTESTRHVSDAEKAGWSSKAAGNHGHTLPSLGAAPSGFGVGEFFGSNLTKNPLDTSLKSGRYGLYFQNSGTVNLPESVFVGYVDVYAYGYNEWHYVTAMNNVSGNSFINTYDGNANSWTGWRLLPRMFWGAPMVNDISPSTEKVLNIALPFTPTMLLVDTSVVTGNVGGTNKTCLLHNNENSRYIAYTNTGYIEARFVNSVLTVRHKVTEAFGFKYTGLAF